MDRARAIALFAVWLVACAIVAFTDFRLFLLVWVGAGMLGIVAGLAGAMIRDRELVADSTGFAAFIGGAVGFVVGLGYAVVLL